MVKYSLNFFSIALLVIHLTDSVTYQEAIPPTATRKDEWFKRNKLKHLAAFFLVGIVHIQ